jgi:hypothetical protein
MDFLRTQKSLKIKGISYKTIIRQIYENDGFSGFYKGLTPSLAQVVPSMGIAFYTFHASKEILEGVVGENGAITLAGIISGITSKSIMMPFDTVRRRLQAQGDDYVMKTAKYKGIIDCVRCMWRVEGWKSFFNGITLALSKSAPVTATTFIVYSLLSRNHKSVE